jgi:hypothetical protein
MRLNEAIELTSVPHGKGKKNPQTLLYLHNDKTTKVRAAEPSGRGRV